MADSDELEGAFSEIRPAIIEQINTVRVMCMPTLARPEDDTPIWTIIPTSEDGPNGFCLIGELHIAESGWRVDATVNMRFRATGHYLLESSEEMLRLAHDFAPWATHVMWDHVSSSARTACALCASAADALHIPLDTPETVVTLAELSSRPATLPVGDSTKS